MTGHLSRLDRFSITVLRACFRLEERASGTGIVDHINKGRGMNVSLQTVYNTARGLVDRKYLVEIEVPGGPERAGRPTHRWVLTEKGRDFVKRIP